MNYYEHHIRDYDAATAHLSWDEDQAYTRLMRWYYRKEKPIPADLKEACRQVRATSKVQREAVETVLHEFFILRDDGWHQETCDLVIAEFKSGEPEREARKANEENRLKRHRDERAKLFKTLTDAGEHAPWNIKIEELRELVKNVSGGKTETAPETKPATPATAPATPATATQTPVPSTQYPVVNQEAIASGIPSSNDIAPEPEKPPALSDPDQPPAARVCLGLKAMGYGDTNPHDPKLSALIGAGLSADEILAAGRDGQGKGKGFRWVLATAEGRRRDAAKVSPLPDRAASGGLSKAGLRTAEAAARWLESQGGQQA